MYMYIYIYIKMYQSRRLLCVSCVMTGILMTQEKVYDLYVCERLIRVFLYCTDRKITALLL